MILTLTILDRAPFFEALPALPALPVRQDPRAHGQHRLGNRRRSHLWPVWRPGGPGGSGSMKICCFNVWSFKDLLFKFGWFGWLFHWPPKMEITRVTRFGRKKPCGLKPMFMASAKNGLKTHVCRCQAASARPELFPWCPRLFLHCRRLCLMDFDGQEWLNMVEICWNR